MEQRSTFDVQVFAKAARRGITEMNPEDWVRVFAGPCCDTIEGYVAREELGKVALLKAHTINSAAAEFHRVVVEGVMVFAGTTGWFSGLLGSVEHKKLVVSTNSLVQSIVSATKDFQAKVKESDEAHSTSTVNAMAAEVIQNAVKSAIARGLAGIDADSIAKLRDEPLIDEGSN